MNGQYVGRLQRRIVLAQTGGRCRICDGNEFDVGSVEYVHILPKCDGGSIVMPMCPNHHKLFDNWMLGRQFVEALGLDYDKYLRHLKRPKKVSSGGGSFGCCSFGVFDNIPGIF